MKICVYGAASNLINDKYIKKVEEIAETLAKRGHDLVFGAGASGLMGAAARGFKRGGAKIYGIIPHFFKTDTIEAIYEQCDKLIFTDTMRERKSKMEELADAFLIVPGGIGTFEEMFEIITLKQLAQHKKPVAFYNIFNYYDTLMEFLEHCEREQFIREGCHNLYLSSDKNDEIIDYLENSKPVDLGIKDLK